MEFRELTASDLDSLLELYRQLSAHDVECTKDRYETVWKEIEENPEQKHISFMRIRGLMGNQRKHLICGWTDIRNNWRRIIV